MYRNSHSIHRVGHGLADTGAGRLVSTIRLGDIVRGFFDGARVTLNNKQAGQNDETLLSPGVGGVLRFKDNLVFSIDWGYALKAIRNGLVKKGASETWLVITVIY